MKKYLIIIALFIPVTAFALSIPFANLGGGSGTINTLDQFTSTSSPATAITQRTYGKGFRLSGQTAGCGTFSSNGTLTSSGVACGTGTPGGSSGQVQYNGSGSFAGVATTTLTAGTNVTFTGTPGYLIGGTNLTINATGGSGTFEFTPTVYGTQNVNATSTGLWLKDNTSLIASTTFATSATSTWLHVGKTNILTTANGPGAYSLGPFGVVTDGTNLLRIGAFGAGASAGVNTFFARSSEASPSAPQLNDDLYFMGARGFGSTVWNAGSKAAIRMRAAQTFTDTANGTHITVETTPNDSTTRAEIARFDQGGNVGIGSTTPWRLLSVGTNNTGKFAISTSTAGCVSISSGGEVYSTGSACGGAGVTSVTATAPIFSSGGATPNITWAGLATTSQPSSSNLLVSNGGAGVFGVATGTISAGTGISLDSSVRSAIGGALAITNSSPLSGLVANYPYSFSNPTLTWLGLSTTTNSGMSAGNLYVGSGGIFQTAASSSIFGYTPLNPTRNINTTWPILGGGDLSVDRTITFGGLSTSTAAVQGNLPYFSGVNTFANVATTSVTCSGNTTCTSFTAIGASPITISSTGGGTGLSTTSPISGSNVLVYSAAGAGAAYGAATTSPTFGLGFTSGGAWNVLGSAPTLSIATSSLYSGTTGQFPYFSGTNTITSTSSLFLATTGYVGIGTTTPKSLLTVAGSFLINTWTNITNAFTIKNSAGTTVFNVDTTSASPLLGIGTTTPASILHVSSGLSATTTIDIGALDTTSKTCVNVRNNTGEATSFYFVGTTMVVEAKRCL